MKQGPVELFDLRLQVSAPLVAFRESVVAPEEGLDATHKPAKVSPV